MITGISALPQVEEKSVYATEEEDKLGKDAFMKLFLAQMNHQDPLNPMDTTQFSAQLAQFSTLEQLFTVNTNLESIEDIQSSDSRYQVLDLIGKEVQAESNTLILNNGKSAEGAFSIEEPAECVVHIMNDNGVVIKDIQLGVLKPGNHSFEWDGFDNRKSLNTSGNYNFSVSALSNSGNTVSVDKYIQGAVTRVSLNEDRPVIYINDTPLDMSQIVNVNTNEASNE